MLEQRVGALETDMKDVKASLKQLEVGFARIEEKFSYLATKEDLTRIESKLSSEISELKGRVSNLPSTWQVIGILAALLVGIASLVYATDSFLLRARSPITTTTTNG